MPTEEDFSSFHSSERLILHGTAEQIELIALEAEFALRWYSRVLSTAWKLPLWP